MAHNCDVVYVAINSFNSGNGGQILRIAAKFEYGQGFSRWVKPSLSSAESSYQVEGLSVGPDGLFFGKRQMPTVPLITAMQDFLEFLKESSKTIVLVGHCTQPIFPLLLQAIFKTNMVDKFHSVIAGFGDSRPAFMKKYSSQKSEEDFELPALARNVLHENYTELFLIASHPLRMIEKLVSKCVLRDEIVRNAIPFETAALKEMEIQYSPGMVENLLAMRSVLSLGMLNKLAQAGLSLDAMMKIHRQAGSKELIKVLTARGPDGEPTVTTDVKILENIADFCVRPAPPAPGETVKNESGQDIETILYSSYLQEQELLEKSKQIYTEIVRGKGNRVLYTIEYTD